MEALTMQYTLGLLAFMYLAEGSSLGWIPEERNPRIVGGTDAAEDEVPWQASLQMYGRHFCGGCIIDKMYIVTAGHCCSGMNKDLIKVYLGSNNLTEGGTYYPIDTMISHEKYNGKTLQNDICLIKLASEIKLSEKIKTINLPVKETGANATCLQSGWGYNVTGDSGGPLVCKEDDKDVLSGMLSWVIPCGRGYPDVFAPTFWYLQWLKDHMKKLKDSGGVDPETAQVASLLTLSDEVKRLPSVKLHAKLKSASLLLGINGELRVAATLANNTVELHSLRVQETDSEVQCLKQITQPGHQKEPRCVALSSDNLAVLSASADSVKLWNRPNQSCLRTIPVPCGRPVRCCFAPGDRHALVGCAAGALLLLDVAAGAVLEQLPAHAGDVTSVRLTPDLRGCYTGGADKTVKFWNFELIQDPTGESKAKVLSLLHTRTLELEEGVLDVKISPNSKFVAVALMDSTVKIFFLDTFKFYLSLYGHKLPVLCLDISYDSALIATGSADRNVKVWGMDFGDCHRSIFAHNDSVTGLQFVPSTHHFFTSSKDGKVKQWDGDTFDNIVTLNGHAGECWGVAVGAGGLHAASCGSDRALRLYARTDEPLVLNDTDEAEEGLATGEDKAPVPGLPNLTLATKKTIGAEKAADSILECLEVGAEYRRELAEARGQSVQLPLLMAAYNSSTPEDFLMETVKKIRSSDLEEALLLLPFKSACDVVRLLPTLLDRGDHGELLCRLAIFLLRVHHASLVASDGLLKHLIQIQAKATMRLNELRDTVGYNVHALQWMQREAEAAEGEQLFRDATSERRKRDKRRRARTALKRAVITVT